MVVRVRPTDLNMPLAADSTYVLTETLGVETPLGQPAKRAYEIVSFTTGSQGRFTQGTVCPPTGELERPAMSALSVGAPRGSAAATTQPHEVDCTAAGASCCEALDIIAPFGAANQHQGPGLALSTAGGTTFSEGEQTDYGIAPPDGTEMILVRATEQPRFVIPRPEFEAAEVVLGALRRRLADLSANDPGTRIAASHVLVTTERRGSGQAADGSVQSPG
jgi:hypothetical protein